MFCKNCGAKLEDNKKYCTNCGTSAKGIEKGSFKKTIILSSFISIVIVALVLLSISFYRKQENLRAEKKDKDIAASVVNIYCAGETEDEDSGGSGTILTEDGLILTNAHIIPKGADDSVSCIVILPDPVTGASNEIYTAYPIIFPEISETYDLAFVQVDDVYYDHEENKAYGEYPKKFPTYQLSKYCKDDNVELGEKVRIYGYPAISGGYALTVTEGVVSSLLLDEGLIVTSAKISHGNSGGLAVDGKGCQIGVPSMVSSDENESLGVIISKDLIYEFIAELGKSIDNENE